MNTNLKEQIKQEVDTEKTEPVKRKRGRPPKKPIDLEAEKIKQFEVEQKINERKEKFSTSLESFSGTILDLISPRLPNPKPFSIEEKNMFSNSLSGLAAKYFSSLNDYDVEMSFIISSVVLFYPRMKKDSDKNKKGFKENFEKEDAKDIV